MSEKFHSDSSSSSDSDDDKSSRAGSVKSKAYRMFGREKPIHAALGGGKPADVFLWRNKKKSAGVLAGATALWVLFELLEYHLITLLCHIMIFSLALLFLWSNASTYINKSPPHIPEIKLPDDCMITIASALIIQLNQSIAFLRNTATGRDFKKFLGVVFGLWVLSVVGNWWNFLTLFYISFILMNVLPLAYENYEDQVDSLAEKAMFEIKKQYAKLDAKFLSKIPLGPMKDKKKD